MERIGRLSLFERARRRERAYRAVLTAGEAATVFIAHLFDLTPLFAYLSVLIPFFLALPALFTGEGRERLIPLALALTLAADACFLLATPSLPRLALVFFLFVQMTHLFYVDYSGGSRHSLCIGIARFALYLPVAALLFLLGVRNVLLFLGALYALFLLGNVRLAVTEKGIPPRYRLGMLFFLGCDVFVALSYLAGRAQAAFFAHPFPFRRVAWLFYPASQTMIALASGSSRA